MHRYSITLPLTLLLLCAASGEIQTQATQPPVRAHHTLAYDPAMKRVLLFGGSTPLDGGQRFRFFNDLWSWDGREWKSLGTSGPEMSGVRIAASNAGRLYAFGGFSGANASLGELRVLEGASWRSLGAHPSVVAAEGGLVWDLARSRLVAFGGGGGQRQLNADVWEFDGQQWVKSTVTPPPARQAHVMVYDARRRRTVVFGGMGASPPGQRPTPLGDLWEYDGTAWTRIDATGPAPRMSAGAAYDSKRGRMIVFGGAAGSAGFTSDTWAWDGVRWTKLADAGPPARAMGELAYDAGRDRVVMFGGRTGWPNGDMNDLWEFDGSSWRRIAP